MAFTAYADLDAPSESINVDINGTSVGTVFGPSGEQCEISAEELIVSAGTFNAAVGGGDAAIHMVASGNVDDICTDSYVSVKVIFSEDCNADGIPDECESGDCNTNGIVDTCDISDGLADCNTNGMPDACDLATGAPDCNTNGAPDACDGPDCNTNNSLDLCELEALQPPDGFAIDFDGVDD